MACLNKTLQKKKYACFSLDFELDYGGRVQAFDTLDHVQGHKELKEGLDRRGIPLSAFVQTSVLEDYSHSEAVLKSLATEVHSHSHSHANRHFDSHFELSHSLEILKKSFGQGEYGYRAPYGKLYKGDLQIIKDLGYAFDSSCFPSFRPGKFNNLRASVEPWIEDGLLEIPFAVMPYTRLILGISYMKLIGPELYRHLMTMTGLPRVLVFYGHMHDFFPTDAVKEFPAWLRWAFGRNGNRSLPIAMGFFDHLAKLGYEFKTMNEMAHILKKEA
jgi:hypothetical protein